MGFEDYQVLLYSRATETDAANFDKMNRIGSALICEWKSIIWQTEVEHSEKKVHDTIHLTYENLAGLIEIELGASEQRVYVSLRFACCNPVSIVEPFSELVKWLMVRFDLYCSLARDTAPGQKDVPARIHDAQTVRDILLPGIDLHRRNWQADVGTSEERVLTPAAAIRYFCKNLY